jgi:hypothetical protein
MWAFCIGILFFQVSCVLTALSWCATEFSLEWQMSQGVFRSLSYETSENVWKFWFSHSDRKYLQEWDSHQPSSNRKELDRERSLCRLVVIECGLRVQRVRNGYEEKRELVDWVLWLWSSSSSSSYLLLPICYISHYITPSVCSQWLVDAIEISAVPLLSFLIHFFYISSVSYWLSDSYVSWLSCYITSSYSFFLIHSIYLTPSEELSGVPKGPALGLHLFIYYCPLQFH